MPRQVDLTAKQTRFVAEYLVDGNGGRVAVAAGYALAGSRVRAHRSIRANKVQAAIAAAQAQDAQRLQTERQDVIAGLLEAIAMARGQANPAAMIAGWREIGRMLGFYAPDVRRVVVGPGAEALTRFESMMDSELLALALAE